MPKFVTVVPYIHQPYFDEFYKTWTTPSDELLLAIDNTEDNAGVAESWNQGIDFMRDVGAEWLIICSATMRFAEGAVKQMYDQLSAHPQATVVHFAKKNITPQTFTKPQNIPTYDEGCFYWHLTAVRAKVFDKVGFFDPNFYPIYFEDTDWDLRYKQTYFIAEKWILPIDATSEGLRHGVEKAGVITDTDKGIAYFATKWGRHPSAAELGEYATPFNDPEKNLKYFPPARGRQYE
jgi:hypothetical protein